MAEHERTIVVLHAKQAIGTGLASAFGSRAGVRVRVWTSGDAGWVFRDGVRPDGFSVEPMPGDARPAGDVEVVTNDEYCLRACADLRERLALPARLPADLEAWTDKVVMKARLRAAGVATPDFADLDPVPGPAAARDLAAGLGLPLVLKPRREANNRGVHVARSAAELAGWLAEHEGRPGWEAESFVSGELHHANALVVDGIVAPVVVGRYTAPLLALSDGRPAGSVTLPEDSAGAAAGRRLNAQVVRALGGRGAFVAHTEFFVTPAGEPVFLETAARAPGALVPEIAEIHGGVHLERASFLLQAGAAVPPPRATGRHAAWLWFPDPRAADRLRPRCEHRLEVQTVGPRFTPAALLAWDSDHDRLLRDVGDALRAAAGAGAGS